MSTLFPKSIDATSIRRQELFHHSLKWAQLMGTLHHQYHIHFFPLIHFHHHHLYCHHIDLST